MSRVIPSGITIPLSFACQIKFNNNSLMRVCNLRSTDQAVRLNSLAGDNRFLRTAFRVESHQRLFALHSNPH